MTSQRVKPSLLAQGDVLSSGSCDYEVESVLGKGSFGEVARCLNIVTKETVAIKALFERPDCINNAAIEVSILEKLRSLDPDQCHIIKYHHCFLDTHTFCIVFELLDISLWDIMVKRHFTPIPLKVISQITQQLATALHALKTSGVIHTDLKPDNIMVTNRYLRPLNIKIIDFGLALTTPMAEPCTYLQPSHYRSPEIFLGLPFSEAIDMWSIGCVLALFVLGGHLYPGNTDYDVVRRIVETQGQPADELLCAGSNTSMFFIKDPPGSWIFKMPEEYEWETGETPQERLVYMIRSLDELQMFITEEEEEDRSAFIDLVKQMLQLDAGKRITPREVLVHRFMMCVDDHRSLVKSTLHANDLKSTLEEEAEMNLGGGLDQLDQGGMEQTAEEAAVKNGCGPMEEVAPTDSETDIRTDFIPDFNVGSCRPIIICFFERLTAEHWKALNNATCGEDVAQRLMDMGDEVLQFVSKATTDVFLPALELFTIAYDLVSPVSTTDSLVRVSSHRAMPTGSQKGDLEPSSDPVRDYLVITEENVCSSLEKSFQRYLCDVRGRPDLVRISPDYADLPGQPLSVESAASASPVIKDTFIDMDDPTYQPDFMEKVWGTVSLMVDNVMEMTGPEEDTVEVGPETLVSPFDRMDTLLSSKTTALYTMSVWNELTDRVQQVMEDQQQEIKDLFFVAGRTIVDSVLLGRMEEVLQGPSRDLTNKLLYFFAEVTAERLLQQFLHFIPAVASCSISVTGSQEGPFDCSETVTGSSESDNSARTSPLPSSDRDEAEGTDTKVELFESVLLESCSKASITQSESATDGAAEDTEDVRQSKKKNKRQKLNYLCGLFSKCSEKNGNIDPTEDDFRQSEEKKNKCFFSFLRGVCSKRSNRIHPEDQTCTGSETESPEDQECVTTSMPVEKKLSFINKVVAFFTKAKKSSQGC